MNKEWFIFKGTHHLGPFSVEELAEMFEKKEISSSTLVWKEGVEKWEPLSKVGTFTFLFHKAIHPSPAPIVTEKRRTIDLPTMSSPRMPAKPELPKAPTEVITHHTPQHVELFDDDLPPPIPLDAILDPMGLHKNKASKKPIGSKNKTRKAILLFSAGLFIIIVAWFAMNEKNSATQLHVKGLMPVYLEKLEMTAMKNTPQFLAELALSLDGQTLWGSTNKNGDIYAVIKMTSIPKRVLGTEDVALTVKGVFNNHLGKFNRMALTTGSKFLPGEYHFHVEGRQIHFLNKTFKSFSAIKFFKSLNHQFAYDGTALIFAGTPREFDKKMDEYQSVILNERLKPYQDKLERIKTFETLINETSQNYLMELERAKTGKNISSFEQKFMKEYSPLLQALVVKANELSKDPKFSEDNVARPIAPYRAQVQIGKQIGEMAADMVTKTANFKKLTEIDKSTLRKEFDKRAMAIKTQIDIDSKQLQDRIDLLSK
jgi:hypothetical protein